MHIVFCIIVTLLTKSCIAKFNLFNHSCAMCVVLVKKVHTAYRYGIPVPIRLINK